MHAILFTCTLIYLNVESLQTKTEGPPEVKKLREYPILHNYIHLLLEQSSKTYAK